MTADVLLKNLAEAVRIAHKAWEQYDLCKRGRGYADSKLLEDAQLKDAAVKRILDQYYSSRDQIKLGI